MTALTLLAALTATTAFSSPALLPAEASSDALTRQILTERLTRADGGVTAAVFVKGADKGIALELHDPAKKAAAEAAALAPLAPAEGLAEKRPAKKKPKKAPRRADEQLSVIERQGPAAEWDKAPQKRASKE